MADESYGVFWRAGQIEPTTGSIHPPDIPPGKTAPLPTPNAGSRGGVWNEGVSKKVLSAQSVRVGFC